MTKFKLHRFRTNSNIAANLGLAIPRADESCVLGNSTWPGGSTGETSSGRLLVMWLGIYGQKVLPGGTSYECRAIAKPSTLPATLNEHSKN